MTLRGRSFVKDLDFTRDELQSLIDLAASLRSSRHHERRSLLRLSGKSLALIFEKTSTRTRCAFEVAAHDEGAHVTNLGPGESQIGYKESIQDTARVLGRMFDGIEYRGSSQRNVELLAEYAGVPVWNGLTDEWHPTQALADVLTMRDHVPKPLSTVTCCYVGDTRNNTANSLLVSGATFGLDIRMCGPRPLWPADHVVSAARERAAASGGQVTVTDDLEAGVEGADFVYTDVWLSMGEPPEKWAERIELLLAYRVDGNVMKATGRPGARFMHCLPALHGAETQLGEELADRFGFTELEVTDEVFESPASIVFDQAENRLHTIKALMVATLAG